MSFFELLKQGGISLFPLAACSVLVVAVVLERIWAFSRLGAVPKELMLRIEGLIARNDWASATRLLDDAAGPFVRVAKASVMRPHAAANEIADTLTLASDAELAQLTRPLPILGTIGNIAPFIGLFGTVIGIMKAFQDVATRQVVGAPGVSQGMSEALIATAVGLGIGIISVVFNNYFNAQVEQFRLQLERFCTEWSYTLQHLQESKAGSASQTESVG